MFDERETIEPGHVGRLSSPGILSKSPPLIMYMGKIHNTDRIGYGLSLSFVSENIRDILGYEPSEILGEKAGWQEKIHPEDRDGVLSSLANLFDRGRSTIEYRLMHRDGHYLWIHDEVALVRNDQAHPKQFIGAWQNITLRKQSAIELKAFQQKWQNIYENMIDVYYKTDMDGRIKLASPSCEMQTGYSQAEVLGRQVTDFYEDPSQRQRLLEVLLEQGQVNDFELNLVHKDGSIRHVSMTGHLIRDNKQLPLGVEGILRNVTERHHAEERLSVLLQENRSLMLQLMQVQEEERRLLARELHDELGQLLTGIGARAEYISKQTSEPEVISTSSEIVRDTNALFQLNHEILKKLRPASLDTLGLSAALEELVDDWRKQTNTECELHIDNDIDHLDENCNIAVYRLVQEALTNAYRHGKATRVDVSIQNLTKTDSRPHSLKIEIEDNGKGIHVENVASGMGMIGMRERVHALGGVFMITDLPFDGVRIDATIPLDNE